MIGLQYPNLVSVYPTTQNLKQAIVNAIWNDGRLTREDLSDISYMLLNEIKRG